MKLGPADKVMVATVSAERQAELNLHRQGFQTYTPRCRVRLGRHVRAAPLFPGYTFILFETMWRSIMGTFGVTRLLMNGADRPALLSASVVEVLRGREDEEGLIGLPPRHLIGDSVVVEAGPFVHCLGVYDGQSGAERCFVLLSLLGRCVRTQVREGDLAAA